MMQSCASAAKFRAAGHSLGRHQVPCSNTAFRHLGSSIRQSAENPVRAPNGAEWSARSGKPFQPAGRKTTPSSVSPVVTKRQSAMSSLRANATIIVLRVPRRAGVQRGLLIDDPRWREPARDMAHNADGENGARRPELCRRCA